MTQSHYSGSQRLPASQFGILALLFFLISFGLGYPTLNRYDARATGNSDASEYYRTVVDGPSATYGHRGLRMLIPYVAKPFYELANGRVGTWDPVFFGLLIANCLFTSATATLMVAIGLALNIELAVALLGGALFLLNFTTVNGILAGMVDSGEVFFLTALAWLLLNERWYLVPLAGLGGALAKETFVPISLAFAGTWWLCGAKKLSTTI